MHQGNFFESSVLRQVYSVYATEPELGEGPLLCGCIYCSLCLYTHIYFLCVNVWVSECMDVELEVFECMAGLERRQCYIAPCIWMLRI